MKKGWEYKTIRECCEILDSRRKPITKSKREPGDIPYYGATGLLDYVKDYIFDETLVLLGEDGAKWGPGESSAYQIYGKTWVNNHAHVLKPKSDIIDNYWLIYYLNYSDLNSFITGVTVPKLNQEKMTSISIPTPPLSEQKEIVEYLDSSFAKIDKLKENAAKNLEEAKALFQSALKDALEPKEGWEEKTLGEMVKDVKYGTSKPACADGAYTYLRMNNITSDGHLDLNDTKTISLDDKELEKCIVRKGDILFNRTNSYEHVGKTCVFTEETPMVIAGYIIRIRLKECLNPYYMNYFFNMKDTKAKLRKISVGAVHQSNINAKAVQTVVIPLPSLPEQQSIVSFLDSLNEKVNTLQQNYSHICDECDALKQAILRQVFE